MHTAGIFNGSLKGNVTVIAIYGHGQSALLQAIEVSLHRTPDGL